MRPASDAYLAALRGSHEMSTRIRLVTPGQTGVTPTGTELAVVNGTVNLDGSADVRTTADLTLAEPWSDDGSAIAPYGQEVYVERGLTFGNGAREWVGLGYLRLGDVEQSDAPAGPLRVSAADRMAGLIEARLLAPVQYAAGVALGTVVSALVTAVYPDAVIEWDDATNLVALTRTESAEEDRHGFLRDLITAQGKIWFFDHRGVLVIRDPPAADAPVYVVDAGPNGVLVSVARSLSREAVYNAVVACGEGTDAIPPVRAVAYDLNVDSLTYWDGDYGKVPRFYVSSFLVTTEQAQRAADSMLAQSLGLPYEVNFGMVPNPALEPLDAVTVVFPMDRSRETHVRRETHVIETLSIPLGPEGAMTATTRLQVLAT